MNKISGVYKITNTVTGDFYIGSSKNTKRRWYNHKCESTWKKNPNSSLYQDMQKYCVDKFKFEVLEETTELKQREQYWMDILKPKYNNYNAKGINVERLKATAKARGKAYYEAHSEEHKAARKASYKAWYGAHRDERLAKLKAYHDQPCMYNGETMTLRALKLRLWRAGIPNPSLEAKKYLCQVEKQ